ncbi:MAG: hypothetical protein ACT4QC_10185 [Planctomycetaceae bacterium]
MNGSLLVLVVGDQIETAEVLRAVLEPRGLTVERARGATVDPFVGGPQRPRLVVVDADAVADHQMSADHWQKTPLIIVGTVPESSFGRDADDAHVRRLSKPFHYADLIRAIDSLVAARAA